MVINKFIIYGKEYLTDEFEETFPKYPKFLSLSTLQSIRTELANRTCQGHTSFMIENFDDRSILLVHCCENTIKTKES